MPKQRTPTTRPPSEAQIEKGKVLQRAIDKSDVKEPPTVGKPVIEEPEADTKEQNQ